MNKSELRQVGFILLLWLLAVAGLAYAYQQRFYPGIAYWRVFITQLSMYATGLLLYFFVIRPWQRKPPLIKRTGRIRF
jgi:hypothetical protein